MDIFDPQKRSEIMSGIKNRDSKIEVAFRKGLWEKGFRYRKNSKNHFGKPDLAFSLKRAVIFIDSCFWHSCPVHGSIPKTRTEFWRSKLKKNRDRDVEVNNHYLSKGWTVIRIWEHDLNKQEPFQKKLVEISEILGRL